ncbi:alpha/beta fold hydrolase [Almyronema epifaneia]|uniref:Alpha/beta fold hydrolase n=1 Tax=Almyronema epifaneia S1 TaxID=2991925 RepID=A0ABW6IE99_9CYAN
MLQFQPIGFGQRVVETALGAMAYYTPTAAPWVRSDQATEEAKPPLVFLHSLGGGSSAYEWSQVYPAFAADYQVIAPDLIGWGQSAHPVHDYRAEDYFEAIAILLETVAQRPAVVAATSLTAAIVIRLAIRRPELFSQLFLVSPSGYEDFGNGYQQGIAARLAGTPGLDNLIYSLGAANETAIANFMATFLFANPDRITPEMIAAYLASATQRQAEYAALASLKGALCCDLSRYMSQLQVPTLFVWGQASRFNRPEIGQRLAALNPTAVKTVAVIPEAGVLPHLELPAIVIGLLRKFLAA